MQIFKTDKHHEYYSDEGCFITEIMNTPEHSTLSIAQARVEAGVETEIHALKETAEMYYILSGRGYATVGEESRVVGKGDCVFINKDETQKIKNIGTEDLVFICICQPRFEQANYVQLS